MEYVGIESIKNAYVEVLQENGEQEEALKLEAKSFTTPVFDGIKVHQDEEPNRQLLNKEISKLAIDFSALDNQFISKAQMYNDLVNDILTDLDSVDEIITIEEERIQDMNMILGNFDEFSSIKTMLAGDLGGSCSIIDEHTFCTYCPERLGVNLEIASVSGNGYEGNKYVYNNYEFEQDYMDTSVRDYMLDDSSTSYFEYSRLTGTDKKKDYPSDVNYDDNEAECVVALESDTEFNTLKIQSDQEGIVLKQVQVSEDGIKFTNTLDKPIMFNDLIKKYENEDYVYGSGIICFPNTNYVKLTFNSSGITDDVLAFKKIDLNDIILARDSVFNLKEYVLEYLVPVFTYYYAHNRIDLPLSLAITISLLMSGHDPEKICAFNFWNLDYNKNLTKQKEDKSKCAFYDREEAINAIFKYLTFDKFEEIYEELPEVNRMNKDNKNTLLFRILKIMSNDYSNLYSTGLDYLEQMNLYRLDDSDKIYTNNKTNLIDAEDIDPKVALKYEQWFIRKDKQEMAYQKMIDEAQTIIPLENVKRHSIRINDITAYSGTYDSSSYIESEELLTGQVSSIAIFANEYVPPSFPGPNNDLYFEYLLIVNGVEYDVIPINSHRKGIKVIRYSGYTDTEDYTEHISEPIKTAKLAIKLNTPDNSLSPYISNIKICMGKAVTK